jgi:hypothetical protein
MAIVNKIGEAEIEVGANTKKADIQLEAFRRRLQQTGRGYDKLFKEDITRKFSENFRKGFEVGVLRGVEKGENQFFQLNRAINVASSSLNKIKGPAEMAADRFMKLQRTGLKMQAAFGTIAGTIGDLAGGILSVVGVLGAAAPAAVALGGAMASVGVGFVGVKVAMAGVSNAINTVWQSQTALNDTFRAASQEYIGLKFAAEEAALSQEDAALKLESAREALARVQDLPPDNRLRRQTELAFKQAELNLRETKHKSEESFRAVKKGIEATSAYQPLASLSAVQLEFVKFTVALRPQMQQLKKEVAEGFIPKLTDAIKTIMKYGFPVFKTGLKQVASAMGDATKTFASAFKNPQNLQQLAGFFKSSTGIIKSFGGALKSSLGILITLLNASAPITKRFADWVDKYLANLDKKVKVSSFTGSLQRMFALAGDVAARLGKAFSTVFDGVKNVIKAAFPSGAKSGAGGVLLDFIDKITKGFEKFTGSKSFASWLENSTKGAVAALSTIGKFLGIFVDLAGSKDTKAFWDVLQEAVPYVKEILENGQAVGTQIATILVDMAKILAAFGDQGTLGTFFNSLRVIFDAFANFVNSPIVKTILGFLGALHGPMLALGAVFLLAKKGLEILLGYLAKAANVMGNTTMKARAAQQAHQVFGREMKLAGQAGETFWQKLKRASATANNQKLLAMGREAGFAKDRLAQLELQMISNSRTAVLFNEQTQESTHLMQLDAAQAEQLSQRISILAERQGMEKEQLVQLNAQLRKNIGALDGAPMTNQQLLNGTVFENGSYKAPFVNMNDAGAYGQPGFKGGANPNLVLTGGKAGFKAVGAGIKGMFGGMGKGAVAGGVGMGLQAASGLFGLGSGQMGPIGMATQAIGGIASMFGPTGMVIGGLLSVGGTIVDGIMAAEAERQKGIKEFKIVTANMSVENLNTIKDFASKAAAAGFVTNKAQAEFRATAFESSANALAGKTGLGNKQMQYDLNAFALSNKRAYDLSGIEANRTAVLTAVGELKKTSPNLKAIDISGALGSLSSITAKTQNSVLQGLQETGLIAKGDKATLIKNLKYNDKGLLTSSSFQKILEDVIAAGKGQSVVTNRTGQLPPSQNRDIQTTKFIPLSENQKGPKFFGYNADYYKGLTDFRENFKLAAGTENLAAQSVGDLFTNKDNGIKILPNGGVQFANDTARSQAAVAVSGLAQSLTGISGGNITAENRTGVSYANKYYSADALAKLKTTKPERYNEVKTYGSAITQKGFNVAGQFFTQEMFDTALKKIKIKTPDGATVSAFDAGIGDKLINVTKISTATQATIKTGNPILDAANATAAVQAKTFTTASGDMKTSAASIGTAAAKFEGYGELIAGNTNKAIAFAIISNTKAGKAAIDSGDQDRVNKLLTQELSKLGLSLKQ